MLLQFVIISCFLSYSIANEDLIYGLITPKCLNLFIKKHDFLNVDCLKLLLSKSLGYAIITGSFILKLPQIIKIIRAKDVTGLLPSAFYIEVLIFESNTIYNILRGYPLNTWGENIVILVQNVILMLLLWIYSKDKNRSYFMIRIFIIFGFILFGIGMYHMPEPHQWILVSAGIPLSILARIPQIMMNFRQKHTGQLALITLALNFGGSAARLFTTYQETGDIAQIIGFFLSSLLNGILIFQIFFYWSTTTKLTEVNKAKKEL